MGPLGSLSASAECVVAASAASFSGARRKSLYFGLHAAPRTKSAIHKNLALLGMVRPSARWIAVAV